MKGLLSASASACLLAVTQSGCYWLTSYQDLTSGPADSEAPVDAAPIDQDAPLLDGGATADGPMEEPTEASPGPFCPPDAGPLVYCMDFDGLDASVLGLGTNQASAGVVSSKSVSPPSSP